MTRTHENLDLGAAAQMTEQAYAWLDKVSESLSSGAGLKEAFEWRDGPYRDYRKKE